MKRSKSRFFSKFLTSSMALTLVATTYTTSQASTFTDVSTSDWYYNYVNDMANENFVSGMTEDTYAPMESLSVAAFSTMISNGFYGETLATEKEQVTGDWWQPYLSACANRDGLIGTVASNSSDWSAVVNNSINRYNMAVMISNLLSDRGVNPISDNEQAEIISKFSDEIDDTYVQSVAMASHYGFISGREDSSFDGSASLNRAEAAVVLSALVKSDLIVTEKVSDFLTSTPTTDVPSVTPEGMVTISFANVGEIFPESQTIPVGSSLDSLPVFDEYLDNDGNWRIFDGWFYLRTEVDGVIYTNFGEAIYVDENTKFTEDVKLLVSSKDKITNQEDGLGLPSIDIWSTTLEDVLIFDENNSFIVSEFVDIVRIIGTLNTNNSGFTLSDGSMTWHSSNESVASLGEAITITDNDFTINGVGTTTITATWTEDGSWNNTTPVVVSQSFTLVVQEAKFYDVGFTVLVDGEILTPSKVETFGLDVPILYNSNGNSTTKFFASENTSLPIGYEVIINAHSGSGTSLSDEYKVSYVEVKSLSGEILYCYDRSGNTNAPKFDKITVGSGNTGTNGYFTFIMPDEPIDIIVNYSSLA